MTTHRPTGNGRIQFGVFFQGVNHTTVWKAPDSGSQTDFESFRRVAQTAERGLFSAFFLGEGLRLREHLGRIHDLDVVGRPDAQTALAALAAVTTNIGLVATQNTTYNDPADLAHRLASLDLLSGGRAAWNIVTTDNAWTGANFRRGGFLKHEDRYVRAEAFVQTAKAIWDSWADGAIAGSRSDGRWLRQGSITPVRRNDASFDVDITGRLPRSAQHHPVLFQAGDSPDGRDFAVRNADVIFSRHAELEDAKVFRADIVARTLKAGRPADDVKIFPGQEFILAATEKEAAEKEHWVREQQVGPETAIAYLEQFWGRTLDGYDPDGPLPEIDPVVDVTNPTRGNAFHGKSARELAGQWRDEARGKGQSIRQFVAARSRLNGRGLVGSYDGVADLLAEYARTGAVDGFNITPWLVPGGLDDIVNELVPRLQDRGVYRTEYEGTTLRENLGLRVPSSHRRGTLSAAGRQESENVA
ncbi:F420-dependent methylene-tetrahydromethanopterin reductase [Arthrobacter sp. ZBG10]|uniref:NtaA/DmoA family FMN-dependent monooxygenase n=1 Tax=unclassified Arthrobacter TaxID=235627 RepID=UPI0006816CC0|nr:MULTISPECIES: NtaA/DmoA family FMN-dependent monooxygenase [unclassified Arthrobacter]KNH22498.1 F420-dependent methylene-tetrahydromethanopterin reductase [Arthrobacter sp. ZBG10]KQQ92265.1 F420-dependent methylene-tetrahydromethanopterin reductase [Arthrobacter sp. Leaf141]